VALRKVAIVGLSPTSHAQAPWSDPEWDLWGLPWDADWPRFHRTFEMHDAAALKHYYPDTKKHLERLKECADLHMHEPLVPNAVRYPIEDVIQTVGDYFCSSISYAMALAIHERADEIALFGIDMKADDEHGYQKPNMEYLLGLARGKGIKVHIPESSPLCKFAMPPQFRYLTRYGRFA
jgi:hypothetical protein